MTPRDIHRLPTHQVLSRLSELGEAAEGDAATVEALRRRVVASTKRALRALPAPIPPGPRRRPVLSLARLIGGTP